jgi:hypothetical protein
MGNVTFSTGNFASFTTTVLTAFPFGWRLVRWQKSS